MLQEPRAAGDGPVSVCFFVSAASQGNALVTGSRPPDQVEMYFLLFSVEGSAAGSLLGRRGGKSRKQKAPKVQSLLIGK